MKARFEFKLQDMWWGVYWQPRQKDPQRVLHIWVCLLPCIPLHIQMPPTNLDKLELYLEAQKHQELMASARHFANRLPDPGEQASWLQIIETFDRKTV